SDSLQGALQSICPPGVSSPPGTCLQLDDSIARPGAMIAGTLVQAFGLTAQARVAGILRYDRTFSRVRDTTCAGRHVGTPATRMDKWRRAAGPPPAGETSHPHRPLAGPPPRSLLVAPTTLATPRYDD